MKFDWERFLKDHNVHYTTPEQSHNVARGWLGLHCPWCGSSDQSDHLGVNLEGGGYSCWRSSSHKGKHPSNLIKEILNCSWTKAKQLEEQYGHKAKPSDLPAAIQRLLDGKPNAKEAAPTELTLPDHFRNIADGSRAALKYQDYLVKRGFSEEDVSSLCLMHGLQCAISGAWKDKIIIPVENWNEDLVTWTTRSISDKGQRYKTLSNKAEKKEWQEGKQAIGPITDYLGNSWKSGMEGEVLAVVEGPFDYLKLDFYGMDHDVRAVCLFGLEVHSGQIMELRRLMPKFNKTVLLFDPKESMKQISALNKLSHLGVRGAPPLPNSVEDAGDLSPDEVDDYCERLLSL